MVDDAVGLHASAITPPPTATVTVGPTPRRRRHLVGRHGHGVAGSNLGDDARAVRRGTDQVALRRHRVRSRRRRVGRHRRHRRDDGHLCVRRAAACCWRGVRGRVPVADGASDHGSDRATVGRPAPRRRAAGKQAAAEEAARARTRDANTLLDAIRRWAGAPVASGASQLGDDGREDVDVLAADRDEAEAPPLAAAPEIVDELGGGSDQGER